MSDKLDDICKRYERDVLSERQPCNFGLFSIPEYPEFEHRERGMWSTALDTILTTLRYLAPATLLTLFWGQQSFLFRLLRHIDEAIRTIIYSSDEQNESVLKWLGEAGPAKVEQLDTVWRHGWILCGVLDTAMPGACAGHPPTRLSLKHAQTIADHYLAVDPVFSRQELESSDCLSKHQEWRLAQYLDRIRLALEKLPPSVSKPCSQRTSPDGVQPQYTVDYVARGSGLTAAQIHSKTYFKIYPTAQQSLEPGEITILIRGPKDTYGMEVIPPILGKAQMIRQKLLNLQLKPHFTENTLPITQGAAYLRTYGRNDMNKTYHIPKTKYDIEIEAEMHEEYARIGYTVQIEGRYDISIVSRGHSIVGSPYTVKASKDIIPILSQESFSLEDGEEIDIVDVKTDRKVLLRIVDFVTEKMILKENGSLEKITDEEANLLTSTENIVKSINKSDLCYQQNTESNHTTVKNKRFQYIARKVIQMTRICLAFKSAAKDRKIKSKMTISKEEIYSRPKSRSGIPDVVNSTFATDTYGNSYTTNENYNTLKPKEAYSYEECTISQPYKETKRLIKMFNKHNEDYKSDVTVKNETKPIEAIDRSNSPNNPFLDDFFVVENKSFITETPNSASYDAPIQIVVEESGSNSGSPNTNPFLTPVMERPKTPVLKIITGEVLHRDEEESVYVDPKIGQIAEEMLRSNEFINPFFALHNHQTPTSESLVADFIIGAPVSLAPVINVPSPNPDMDSLMITSKDEHFCFDTNDNTHKVMETSGESSTGFSTPLQTKVQISGPESPTFHSLESISEIDQENADHSNQRNLNQYEIDVYHSKKITKKEMWDSAYVSIDETNTSGDSNNNDNTSFSPSEAKEDFSKMGPAEKELWATCHDLCDTNKTFEDRSRWEGKRLIFTPILEESDRSFSAGMKEPTMTEASETDPVTVVLANLDNIFQDYNTNSEQSSISTTFDDKIPFIKELEHAVERYTKVESASEHESDVTRLMNTIEGRAISEVQPNATESVSASQRLQITYNNQYELSTNHLQTQFGEEKQSNIVLEKKKYWDEKIRLIEEMQTEEPKPKKVFLKTAHGLDENKSQREKNISNSPLTSGEQTRVIETTAIEEPVKENPEENSNIKLVEKWKKYWDDKLETEKEEEAERSRSITPKTMHIEDKETADVILGNVDEKLKKNSPSKKQELPEEVFKAFETSPKRFFGTSRKQILNKIDSFIGSPSTVTTTSPDIGEGTQDKGIVSSRISMFHNISQVEDTPRKSRSLHNIRLRSESEKNLLDTWSIHNVTEVSETVKVLRNGSLSIDIASKNKLEEPKTSETAKKAEVSLKDKRQRMKFNAYNSTFGESVVAQKIAQMTPPVKERTYVQNTVKDMNKYTERQQRINRVNSLRKSSVSKSEMDIFSKIANVTVEDDLEKHKSYDELPKIDVKSFISKYETVTESAKSTPKLERKLSRTGSTLENISIFPTHHKTSLFTGTGIPTAKIAPIIKEVSVTETMTDDATPHPPPRRKRGCKTSQESLIGSSIESITDLNIQNVIKPSQDEAKEEKTYISLSDIDVEIIDKSPDLIQPSPEKERDPIDYKSRFKMAKQYFQSLEELPVEPRKHTKLNECQQLLFSISNESPEDKPQKRVKKGIRKSNSMPSSEFAMIWHHMQESQEGDAKLVKISEKFNVEDLFNDVVEGKLSRQGSLRGIPHKKAVLEAFKSMENVSDAKLSSYEIAVSQLSEFAKENKITRAQTYLTEYPYLPTTDPSKYHSRLDTKATGLISMKELLNTMNTKFRRNSVPDLRLNPKFTVDL